MTDQVELRAELRRYAGANFQLAAIAAGATMAMQFAALTLASMSGLRTRLDPWTPWWLLVLAGGAPYFRSVADSCKREGDELLRRIELGDALGRTIPPLEVEEVKCDASMLIGWLARLRSKDLRLYASSATVGPRRLVENTRESAWWSTRLSRDLSRWQFSLTGVFAVGCFAALYEFARRGPAANASADLTEFAAALLVFVFAEAFFRRGMDFRKFAEASARVVGHANGLLARAEPSERDAMLLMAEYQLARQAAPRISDLWYRHRKDRLNEAWARGRKPVAK